MLLDLVILACGFSIGWIFRCFGAGRRAESGFHRLAGRRTLAILVCCGLAMLPRLALLPWIPPRLPAIMDESSYVFGAQTLAAGRLANPTPAFWQHFETFHINLVPSYQSMYPPAPSLFYALGIVAGGGPWWGLWLSTGLMCGAICWALQPLVRPRYALLAGIFCSLKYGVFSIFSDWYLGGAVAALGGALVLGGYLRLISTARLRQAVWLVIGIAILANARPFEGALFSLPIGVALLIRILQRRQWKLLAATAAMLALLISAMGYYNLRSTGSAWKMPYMENFEQYHYVLPLLGMGMQPRPQYRHPEMGILYDQWEGERGLLAKTASGIMSLNWEKFRSYYHEHFGPVLLLALLGVAASLRSPRGRIPAIALLLVCCGLFCTVYRQFSAYPAPMLAGFFGFAMTGIRRLNAASIRRQRLGPYLGRGLMAVLLIIGAARLGENVIKGLKATGADPAPWNVVRARMIDNLTNSDGQHLIFVKYLPQHNGHEEWVYNTPDLDRQKVIWARSMGEAEDHALMKHYPGRQFWLIKPDAAYMLIPAKSAR
jgi:hypothetical protein